FSPEDYFAHGNEDTENSMKMYIVYSLQFLRNELNRITLDSLLELSRKRASTFQRGTDDWASGMRANEIPTAALVRGVNVPNHEITFQSASDQLQQSVTPFVHLMQRVLERLMGACVSVDVEEEEEPKQHSTNVNQKRVHCSLGTLCDWYITYFFPPLFNQVVEIPGCKKHTSVGKDMQQHPPILVIFKDLEAFNPRVLRYVEQLPLMFVFDITTSPSTIQHMLPQSIFFLLCIELFQSLSCTRHLTTVIDKRCLFSGLCVCVLTMGPPYQLALLEHFHSQPLSVLCLTLFKCCVVRLFKTCCDSWCLPRTLSPRYVEKQAPQEQMQLLTSDDHVKEVCQKLLKVLRKYHKNHYPILRYLHVLTSSLPKYPLGKQIRELHISCLEKNVWENEECVSAMQLRMMAKDELVAALQKCTEILKTCRTESSDDDEAGEIISSPGKGLQKKTDLFQLQKYEVCYYSSFAVLGPHLNAMPSRLPSNENLLTEDGTISNAAPDICIVYKLHMECGRLAYATVVSAAEGKDADYGKVDELKRQPVFFFFIQAVSELEFLRFIKSTKQKSDLGRLLIQSLSLLYSMYVSIVF
uniref:Origin recognition complex, subunit 3 n=1 Tax=Salmo trutta TaxID=8032 RepID=A0A674BY02_SALTR